MKYVILYEKFVFADGYFGASYSTEYDNKIFNSLEEAIEYLEKDGFYEEQKHLMNETTAMIMSVGSKFECVNKMFKVN